MIHIPRIDVKVGNFIVRVAQPDLEDFEKAKKLLEDNKFELLGWSASEGLYATGAWKQNEKYVVHLVNSEPFMDQFEQIIYPDPFHMPEATWKTTGVFVYEKPFEPYEDGEEWEMDGSPPSAVSDINEYKFFMMFGDLQEAIDFVDWLMKK